ncbi:hypothetical protein DIE15_08135 [Burkholderia sp. Bp9031]|nr:hypothetical protein DIE15_08135 [Burkholderia sp. Bp9031]
MRNPAFSHLSPAPLVRRYGPRLRPYDTSSSIRGHSKPDRAAQISRIRDVYDDGEQCFAARNRPDAAPRLRRGRCDSGRDGDARLARQRDGEPFDTRYANRTGAVGVTARMARAALSRRGG